MLSFEQEIIKLENEYNRLTQAAQSDTTLTPLLKNLEKNIEEKLRHIYTKLSIWQKVEIARHDTRPRTKRYIESLISQPTFLSGDRCFGDDTAIIGCIGFMNKTPVMLIGQERGHDTKSRIAHNFGMPKPEGYRKTQRLINLANKFHLPIITLVDTPGAYPGAEAENRGQAEAIARCVEVALNATVPIISVIIGEGGSGGALALATANKVLMLEHAVYSVISPEGCASILWRDATKKELAAEKLQCSAQKLLELKVIHRIIEEPLGGAHRHPEKTMLNVQEAALQELAALQKLSKEDLLLQKKQHFMSI